MGCNISRIQWTGNVRFPKLDPQDGIKVSGHDSKDGNGGILKHGVSIQKPIRVGPLQRCFCMTGW
jgi:hypothetical protein